MRPKKTTTQLMATANDPKDSIYIYIGQAYMQVPRSHHHFKVEYTIYGRPRSFILSSREEHQFQSWRLVLVTLAVVAVQKCKIDGPCTSQFYTNCLLGKVGVVFPTLISSNVIASKTDAMFSNRD